MPPSDPGNDTILEPFAKPISLLLSRFSRGCPRIPRYTAATRCNISSDCRCVGDTISTSRPG